MIDESGETFKSQQIKGIGFTHIIFPLEDSGEEKVFKVIKYGIDHLLSI